MIRSTRQAAIYCLAIFTATAGLWAPDASAQLYPIRHRPPDASYQHFRTSHFYLIYEEGLYTDALETARILERLYPRIKSLTGLKRDLKMPVVLNHFSDRANGFVSPLPFRQELEAVNLRGKTLSPRFSSWFETVAPHELMHAAHAESGEGFGVGWILRRFGADLARSLNLSGPRGINEGAAVWLESNVGPSAGRLTVGQGAGRLNVGQGAGRLNYPNFEMEFRAAMLSDDPWSLAQMLEPPTYTMPFDRYYHGGAHVFQYLVENGKEPSGSGDATPRDAYDTGDLEFFQRSRNFFYRFPLLGYGPALWFGTGMRPSRLSTNLRAYYREKGQIFQNELGQLTESEMIASVRGASYRRPRWIDEETLVAYVSGYEIRPGFYRVDLETGERDPISYQSLTEDAFWSFSSDSSGLFFSRYVPSAFTPAHSISEIFYLDLSTGRTSRVTKNGRAYGAIPVGASTLWALRNVTQFNEWIKLEYGVTEDRGRASALELSRDAPSFETVGSYPETRIIAIEPISGRKAVAVLMNRGGRQGVYLVNIDGGRTAGIEPCVVFEDASVLDVESSGDGRYLVLSADLDGVSNIYAYDLDHGRLVALTNVPFGAIEPTVSIDNRWVAYINYRHERYELVRIPFRPEEGRPVEFSLTAINTAPTDTSTLVTGGAPTESESLAWNDIHGADTTWLSVVLGSQTPRAYRPILNVRPRVVFPFLLYQRPTGDEDDTDLGFGAGFGVEWADPLQYWSATTSLFYQHTSFWGRARLQSGHTVPRPSVEVFRSPSTVQILRGRGATLDTVRVGREERGVALGVGTPVVLSANVFQTHAHASISAEFRQERLFDDENETIRPADDRVTINPGINLSVRVQRNPRDIVPNSGILASVGSKLDVWAESGEPARWVTGRAVFHIPLLQEQNIGVQINTSVLSQNRGGIFDSMHFFPRGYETDNAFLGRGTFAKYGIEYTQPFIYIDDGFILLPIFFKALFGYAFIERMQGLHRSSTVSGFTTAGAGLGLQFRFAHSIDATIRIAPVYKFKGRDWSVTFR